MADWMIVAAILVITYAASVLLGYWLARRLFKVEAEAQSLSDIETARIREELVRVAPFIVRAAQESTLRTLRYRTR